MTKVPEIKDFKLIFIDLDGTLMNRYGHISEENKKAINLAKKRGQEIIISTGRMDGTAEGIMKELNLSYAVTGNGSKIVDKNSKVLQEFFLSKEDVKEIFHQIEKEELVIKLDGDLILYGVLSKIMKYWINKTPFTPMANYNFDKERKYHKITLWGKMPCKMKKIYKKLKTKFKDSKLNIVNGHKNFVIEITNKEASKGKGNFLLAKKIFKITERDKMLHIGNGMNDYSAKDFCHIAAVKNSPAKLKKAATFIGPHFKKSGVAKILNNQAKIT